MNSHTPEFPLHKETQIRSFIQEYGYDENMTQVIYNILTLTPDINVVPNIPHFTMIRLAWSLTKAGLVYDDYMWRNNNPSTNYFATTTGMITLFTNRIQEAV